MRLVILAAGKGTRLGKFSRLVPKPLVKLGKYPIIKYILYSIEKLSISKVTVVTGYKSECWDAYPIHRIINQDYEVTNMVYSFELTLDLFDGQSDVIVSYGDIIVETEILEKLTEHKGKIVVTADKQWLELWKLRMDDPLEDAETFSVNSSGHVTELGQKINSLSQVDGQYMGLVKFSANSHKTIKSMLNQFKLALGDKYKTSYFTDFIQYLIDNEVLVNCLMTNRGWLEVDTVEDKEKYESLIVEKNWHKLGINLDSFKFDTSQ